MERNRIDVIIPVYRPGAEFEVLIRRLEQQKKAIGTIFLMHTKDGSDLRDMECIKDYTNIVIEEVEPKDFDHGGTRDKGMCRSDAEYVLCMTQDAVPDDTHLTEYLLQVMADETVAVSYARQLPRKNCRLLEQYTRSFNYPEQSRVKSLSDLEQLGIKTYFCSNVCALYRKERYEDLGGFEKRTIFNEDMLYAAACIQKGYKVAYVAEARVIHSHNYTNRQQFHRNFDLAVSQAEHPEVFEGVKSESEGIRMVKSTAVYLIKNRHPLQVIQLLISSAAKYAGYLLGKNYRHLPRRIVLACTMNPRYWGES